MNDSDIRSAAESFWSLVGSRSAFPRDLEASILWSLPLVVVKIPRLRTQAVRDWLTQDGLGHIVPAPERELRACIVACRGRGIVFIDGADSVEEQRMSLAHELAHFLLDYVLPRDQAVKSLGESILAVLDGDRAPTPAERLSAVLKGVPIGIYSRLWHRGPRGIAPSAGTLAREDAADVLALELLAPRRDVLQRARQCQDGMSAESLTALLQSTFGLPESSAWSYAGFLAASAKPTQSIKSWLGINPQ